MSSTTRARALLGTVQRRLIGTPAVPAQSDAPRGDDPTRKTHYPALPGDRLLEQPVFVLCSMRSGSTLLRLMLNSHSAIHAPHEMHLAGVRVNFGGHFGGHFVREAMAESGMDEVQLEFLLWDRLLHREMSRHGKRILVNKTPSDAFRWRRIVECWPDARFIYLLRHPAAIAKSWERRKPNQRPAQAVGTILRYLQAVEDARTNHSGLTVRYEDLTADPARELRRICEFIGVDYEPAMIDYSRIEPTVFKAGLGDTGARIRSGKVQPVKRLPRSDKIPPALIDISKKWGYLS